MVSRSRPATRATPALGRSSPDRIVSSVDLPEPGGPDEATSSPRPTSRSSPCRATTSTPSEEKMRTRLSQRMSGPVVRAPGRGSARVRAGLVVMRCLLCAGGRRGCRVGRTRRRSGGRASRCRAPPARRRSPVSGCDRIGRRVTAPVKGARSRAGASALGTTTPTRQPGDHPHGEQRQHLGPGEAALAAVGQAHRAQADRELGALAPGSPPAGAGRRGRRARPRAARRRGRWRRPGWAGRGRRRRRRTR